MFITKQKAKRSREQSPNKYKQNKNFIMRVPSYLKNNYLRMKSFIILIFSMIAFCCRLHSQTISTAISFEETVYNFGKILESKGKVSHTFIFWNRSNAPVAIEGIAAGCGCTTFSYAKEPVRPGEMGKITVTFNPLYRPGFFSKEIIIFSNSRTNINRVWVKGNVIPFLHPVEEDYPYSFGQGLYLNLKVLAFGSVTKGTTKQINLRYANNNNNPMTLGFIVEGNDKNIKLSNPGKLVPMQRGQMSVDYTMIKLVRGEIIIKIYPIVNGKRLSQPLLAKITGIE
jgi:hypothetical protein